MKSGRSSTHEGEDPRAKAAPEAGDVWTWTAICADTKLVPSWTVGDRSAQAAVVLMDDLASRLAHRIQLTSDGHAAYVEAVEATFGENVDLCPAREDQREGPETEKRYSPPECIGAHKRAVTGRRDAPKSRPATSSARTSPCK